MVTLTDVVASTSIAISLSAILFALIFVPTIVEKVNQIETELQISMDEYKIMADETWDQLMTTAQTAPHRRAFRPKRQIYGLNGKLKRPKFIGPPGSYGFSAAAIQGSPQLPPNYGQGYGSLNGGGKSPDNHKAVDRQRPSMPGSTYGSAYGIPITANQGPSAGQGQGIQKMPDNYGNGFGQGQGQGHQAPDNYGGYGSQTTTKAPVQNKTPAGNLPTNYGEGYKNPGNSPGASYGELPTGTGDGHGQGQGYQGQGGDGGDHAGAGEHGKDLYGGGEHTSTAKSEGGTCQCNENGSCPPGPPGPPGEPGLEGEPGLKGKPGVKGPPGVVPESFWDRPQEPCIQCPPGQRGAPGPDGKDGKAGSQGRPGTNGNPGYKGYAGPTGPYGNPGTEGPSGRPGDQGFQGRSATQYTKGAPGDKGYQGVDGSRGSYGAPGTAGKNGDDGQAGAQGEQGKRGTDGRKGPKGKIGKSGPPGNDAKYCPCPKKS